MANPFTQIKVAAVATAGTITGIRWADKYNGQTPAQVASRIDRAGSGCYVRVPTGTRDASRSGVQSDVLVHFITGAKSLRSRASASDAADQILWDLLDNLQGHRLNLSWLMMGLEYRDFETIIETETCVVKSLIMGTRFDMAQWTE